LGRGGAGGWIFHWWLVGALVFVLSLAPRYHPWYALALAPAAAGLAGAALERAERRLAQVLGRTLGLAAGGLGSILRIVSSWRALSPLYIPWNDPAYHAGKALDRLLPGDALVAVVDGGDPTALYYSRRRGWHFLTRFGAFPHGSQQAIAELMMLKRQGLHSLTVLSYER